MGALTSNRKHGEDRFRLNKRPPHRNIPNFQVSKKPRFSVTHQAPESGSISLSNSAASRISRYPEAKPPFPGQPHASSRNIRLGSSRSNCNRDSSTAIRLDTGKENSTALGNPRMWNVLIGKCEVAKRNAYSVLRYFGKSDDEIVEDTESGKEVKSDDSSVEEVVVIEDEKGSEKIVEDRSLQACSSLTVTEINNDSLAVENAEKMLSSLSLDGDVVDVSGVGEYKKLLESGERRSSKIETLGFEIEFNRKKWRAIRALQTARITKEKPAEVPQELFAPLSKDDEAEVRRAFASGWILASHVKSNIEITGQILQCLRPGAWLNDEVINLYLELLKERESREPKRFLRCHFFNTFFYKKLVGGENGYNYIAVRRWTSEKKLGYCLSSCDKIFVPIHKEDHWCLAVISKKDRKFQYLDSFKGKDHGVLSALARYYVEEVKNKSGEDIDVSSWEQEVLEDLPAQENGSDCGMFMLKYVDFYSRGLGLCFGQRHMPYFRLRTAKEILRLRAD